MKSEQQRIEELERQIERMSERDDHARAALIMYADIQQRLVVSEQGRQNEAAKWREKIGALENELRLAQRGKSSGCGCPIGQCLKRRPDAQGCWFQWAEAHVYERAGQIFKGQVQRYANHPARLREPPDEEQTKVDTRPAGAAGQSPGRD